MKRFFRDYFTFNKKERNAVIVLISIIILLIIYLNVADLIFKPQPVDFSAFEKEIAELQNQKNNSTDTLSNFSSPDEAFELEYFQFNPNHLANEDWKKLGLSDKQIQTIKNYESKGGRFRKKEDLKKIYGISPELYLKLEPYITFGDTLKRIDSKQLAVGKDSVGNNKLISNKNLLIELNSTDSATLTTIKGIGPFFAKSIIKQRNALGGFYKKEQLLEIWKFDEEKLKSIENHITIDATKIKKVNINTCEAKDLKTPYINWNQANAIVNYRKKHGNYKSVDEIKKTDLVNEETFRKIEPYLTTE